MSKLFLNFGNATTVNYMVEMFTSSVQLNILVEGTVRLQMAYLLFLFIRLDRKRYSSFVWFRGGVGAKLLTEFCSISFETAVSQDSYYVF